MKTADKLGEMADKLELQTQSPAMFMVRSEVALEALDKSEFTEIYGYRTSGYLKKDPSKWLVSKAKKFLSESYNVLVFETDDKIVFNRNNWYFELPYQNRIFRYLLDNQL